MSETANAPAGAPEVSADGKTMNGAEPTKVLVIDDDELTLAVIRKLLEAENCVVEAFSSPRQALSKLPENHYDAILCDMWMGDMSGKDFYQQIQQDFPDYRRKIIFVTGDFASEATWEFIDERQLPFILKPFSLPELHRRLREVVGERVERVQSPKLQTPWDGIERRNHRRYAIKAQVRVRGKKRAVISADIGMVANASKEGVFFVTDREYRTGMEVFVALPYTGYNDIEQEGYVVRVEELPEGRHGVAVALGGAAETARAKFECSTEDSRRNHILLKTAEKTATLPADTSATTSEISAAEKEARRLAEELAELKEAHDRVLNQRDSLAAEEAHIKKQLHELNTAKSTMSEIINDLTSQMETLQRELAAGEETRFLATHDSLTGLWNRAVILEILQKELVRAQREGTSVGVLMADLDYFKKINDTYGHLAGDTVLREVAQRLQTGVREYDAVGRYGGEEFLIILPACQEIPLKHAERLRKLVSAEPIYTDDGVIHITLSLGVAASTHALSQPEVLLRAADAALYRAKRGGHNRVESATTQDAANSLPAGR
ncbi:MAG: diguanylate cyclase [Acidobacteria bacterium]|nr:diguanylate cyclase [Acidobacteriota bacterium]